MDQDQGLSPLFGQRFGVRPIPSVSERQRQDDVRRQRLLGAVVFSLVCLHAADQVRASQHTSFDDLAEVPVTLDRDDWP